MGEEKEFLVEMMGREPFSVKGDGFAISQQGHLRIYDLNSELVAAYAPGMWVKCSLKQEEQKS